VTKGRTGFGKRSHGSARSKGSRNPHLPLSARLHPQRSAYRALPTPRGGALQSRYLGRYLVYGTGTGWRPPQAIRQLRSTSASLLFLRNTRLRLSEIGTLHASAEAGGVQDPCTASCVDWYGNSRPLFVRGRIFALLGYEIVEGSLNGPGIAEVRRVSYAPHWVQQLR
jgi:hypothetical protein